MLYKRFFLAWLVSAIVMYTMSYLWHGMLLNDFHRLSYSRDIFLILSAIVYLAIGIILSALNHLIELKKFKKKTIFQGMLFGMVLGAFIYLIAFVFGISFYATPHFQHVVMDFSWQMIEQTAGGAVSGFVYSYFKYREKFLTI